ncbi:hypothetical protein M8J77_011796 [Diaphorina citri]|nr:hypothetical protein M8J77_011796 [Diaphorina citri]
MELKESMNNNEEYDSTISKLINELLLENETITYEDIDDFVALVKSNSSDMRIFLDPEIIESNITDFDRNAQVADDNVNNITHLDQDENDIHSHELDEEQLTADVQYMNDEANFNNGSEIYYTDEVENFVNNSELSVNKTRNKHKSVNFQNKLNNVSTDYVNKTEQSIRNVTESETMPLDKSHESWKMLKGEFSDSTIGHWYADETKLDNADNETKANVLKMVDATFKYDVIEKNNSNTTWPIKQAAEIPGDILLGALMMVHSRSESVTCGPVMAQGGIQALETMLYTLDVINARKDKKITIGAHILDDCDTDTYGLEMALDFIKDAESLDSVLYLRSNLTESAVSMKSDT